MADYIDRQAALDELQKEIDEQTNPLIRCGIRLARNTIDELPSADAVEVVRCRDCRYWQDNNGGYPHDECRWGKDETPDADDYCSYGVRKDERH